MVEIFSKSLVRAIGRISYSKNDIVKKQLFQWSASITLDRNNDENFSHFSHFIRTSVGLTSCISIVVSV